MNDKICELCIIQVVCNASLMSYTICELSIILPCKTSTDPSDCMIDRLRRTTWRAWVIR